MEKYLAFHLSCYSQKVQRSKITRKMESLSCEERLRIVRIVQPGKENWDDSGATSSST